VQQRGGGLAVNRVAPLHAIIREGVSTATAIKRGWVSSCTLAHVYLEGL